MNRMPEKQKNSQYEHVYKTWRYLMMAACAWIGLNMLFNAYDQACESNLLPREWCKWSTIQPVQREAIPTPLPPIQY